MKQGMRFVIVAVCLAVIGAGLVVLSPEGSTPAPVLAVDAASPAASTGAGVQDDSTPPRAFDYACGAQALTLSITGEDSVTVTLEGQVHHLSRSISASGEKYDTAPGIAPAVMFWGKGDKAFLEIDGGARVECLRADAAPAREQGAIENTTWQATRLNGKPLAADVVLTLVLDGAGRLSGRSGCNRYTGPYAIDVAARSLTVSGPVAGTRMACLPPLMETESVFLALLPRITAYTQEQGELVIYAGTEEVLRMVPSLAP